MLIVRPVRESDHAEILALAHKAGIGMTSLPPDPDVLAKKIARSEGSFAQKPEHKGHEAFLMVLEDTDQRTLVGTTGIAAHVGTRNPFYSYKLSTIVQASASLGVYSFQRVLHMVNDFTGATEIGSLFLLPEYRRDGIGKFLSRCRYLMLAQFGSLFSDVVISEIRGVQDAQGHSPFYRNLAQHFFQMEFKMADFIHATQGGQFISDLMPRYPIYVNLLLPEAQEVIAKPLEASLPAMDMLMKEGFRYQGYIDVFDAGPTVQANRADIRTVRKSRVGVVSEMRPVAGDTSYMVATCNLETLAMTLAPLELQGEGVALPAEVAQALGVKVGDMIRYIEA
jgi:arginine N-succinyltransferase